MDARRLKIALLFFVLIAAATYPLVNVFKPVLPTGEDSLFNVWRVSVVAHQLRSDPAHLLDGNVFFPERRTLTFSDAMLAVAVIGTPFIWAGVHPVVVQNLLMLAGFVTSALAAYMLCRELTSDDAAAFYGGVVFSLAPFRFAHINHLELQWAAFIPLTLWLLYRASSACAQLPRGQREIGPAAGAASALARASGDKKSAPSPSLRHATAAGLAFTVQGLCSLYYLAFFTIYLAAWTILTAATSSPASRLRLLRAIGVLGVVAAILLTPYYLAYASSQQTFGPRRTDEVSQFSAVPSDYLRVSEENKLRRASSLDAQDERSLFPGFVTIALAVVGIVAGADRQRFVFAALAALAFELSLGSNGQVYPLLLRLVPAFGSFRAPARCGIFVLLSLAALSSIGLAALSRKLHARTRGLVIAVLLAGSVAEYWSAPVHTREVPLAPSNVYRWLASQPRAVVLELPTPQPGRLWYVETVYQYMSTYHWHWLVNGYSGHVPTSYAKTIAAIAERNPASIGTRLDEIGVRYLVLHEKFYEPAEFADALNLFANLPHAGALHSFQDRDDPAVVISWNTSGK